MNNLNELNKQTGNAPAAQQAAGPAAAKPAAAAPKSKNFKKALRIAYVIIYLAALLSLWLYNKSLPSDAELHERASALIQEAQAELIRQQREAVRQSFSAPVALPQQQERVNSVDLLRQSAETDGRLGNRQPASPRQTEQLDYGAQVADYQAQLKAQEDAQKAKEAEAAKKRAEQDALARQEQAEAAAAQKQPTQKQQLKTSPRVAGGAGGTYGGGSGGIDGLGKSVTFRPKQ
jgi:hypothetical protein